MDFIYGIVLILVTLFVHRFTWTSEVGEGVYRRAKFPLILVVLIVVLGIIPIVNYVAFVCGGIVYVINLIASSGKTRFLISLQKISETLRKRNNSVENRQFP